MTECIGPRGSTGTFHSSSGQIAKTRETSSILGAVFKLQRMRNRIKQILQKCEEVLPDSSASRASKQSEISDDERARASATIYEINSASRLIHSDVTRIVIQSCDMRTLKVL